MVPSLTCRGGGMNGRQALMACYALDKNIPLGLSDGDAALTAEDLSGQGHPALVKPTMKGVPVPPPAWVAALEAQGKGYKKIVKGATVVIPGKVIIDKGEIPATDMQVRQERGREGEREGWIEGGSVWIIAHSQ